MIVLDTNVVSELMRPSPVASVIEWVALQAAPSLYLSAITEAELRYGVEILPVGQHRDRLRGEIEGMLREDFARRVLPFDRSTAQAYAVISGGRPIHRGTGRNERRGRVRRVWDRLNQSMGDRMIAGAP